MIRVCYVIYLLFIAKSRCELIALLAQSPLSHGGEWDIILFAVSGSTPF